MSDLAILPEGYEPPSSWRRIRLVGGSHDGTILWAQNPPRRLSIVEGGDEYASVGDGVYRWHEPGQPEPRAGADPTLGAEQLALG